MFIALLRKFKYFLRNCLFWSDISFFFNFFLRNFLFRSNVSFLGREGYHGLAPDASKKIYQPRPIFNIPGPPWILLLRRLLTLHHRHPRKGGLCEQINLVSNYDVARSLSPPPLTTNPGAVNHAHQCSCSSSPTMSTLIFTFSFLVVLTDEKSK